MIASVAIVALNEELYINRILNDILEQQYPKKQIEVLLIDSGSDDKTLEFMESFKTKYVNDFYGIQILKNVDRIQAAGWNVAIKNFKGDVLFRIDAHAHIPNNFVLENMKLQDSGEVVTGGPRYTLSDSKTLFSDFLLQAENSMFGSSIASYRRSTANTYVKSLFHGAYRRSVLEKVGLFNTSLGRTEDNEFHYRIRQKGYKLCYSGDIFSYQYIRSTFIKMLKQKYGNGYWIGRTFWICHKCLEKYHFVPLFFVLGIIFTTVLGFMGYPILSMVMWMSYFLLCLIMMILTFYQNVFNPYYFMLPIMFIGLHLSYGLGTLWGIMHYGDDC